MSLLSATRKALWVAPRVAAAAVTFAAGPYLAPARCRDEDTSSLEEQELLVVVSIPKGASLVETSREGKGTRNEEGLVFPHDYGTVLGLAQDGGGAVDALVESAGKHEPGAALMARPVSSLTMEYPRKRDGGGGDRQTTLLMRVPDPRDGWAPGGTGSGARMWGTEGRPAPWGGGCAGPPTDGEATALTAFLVKLKYMQFHLPACLGDWTGPSDTASEVARLRANHDQAMAAATAMPNGKKQEDGRGPGGSTKEGGRSAGREKLGAGSGGGGSPGRARPEVAARGADDAGGEEGDVSGPEDLVDAGATALKDVPVAELFRELARRRSSGAQ